MKALRTYQRAAADAKAALPHARALLHRDDAAAISLAVGLLSDLAETLPAIEKREKARRERIQWVYAGNHTYVAIVGRTTFRCVFGAGRGVLSLFNGLAWERFGEAGTSIESASRLIRRLRKARQAIRDEADKCSVPFERTRGDRAVYPSFDGVDFVVVPIVIVRRIPEGRIARMPDGAFTLLPKDFPVETVDDVQWARDLAAHHARKEAA